MKKKSFNKTYLLKFKTKLIHENKTNIHLVLINFNTIIYDISKWNLTFFF